jgi:hypothetical protein
MIKITAKERKEVETNMLTGAFIKKFHNLTSSLE